MSMQSEEILFRIIEKRDAVRSNLDNSLLRISALGIPLTIVLLDKDLFIRFENYEWLFGSFVVLWGVTVLTSILSMRSSEKGHEKEEYNFVRGLDGSDETGQFLRVNTWNHVSLWSFLFGVLALGSFVLFNLAFS